MLGRIQIEADDVLQFLGETRIVAQLESFHAVRLYTVTVTDAPYTCLADTGHGGHSASAPVGCMRRSFLCRLGNHHTHEFRGDGRRAARSRSVVLQPRDTVMQ